MSTLIHIKPTTNRTADAKNGIHAVLKETRYAYDLSCESASINADYAEYASLQALHYFRQAFGKPDLTREQLCRLLRRAAMKEARRTCKTPWPLFMANYLERKAAMDQIAKH